MICCCGDCNAEEGELHEEGCDMEYCGKCGKQVLAWGRCKDAKPEPFFVKRYLCVRCGSDYDCFMLTDECWKNICGVTYDKEDILCERCIRFIAEKRNIPIERKPGVLSMKEIFKKMGVEK